MPSDLERHLALLTLLCSAPKALSWAKIREKLPHFYPETSKQAVDKMFSRDKEALNGLGWAVMVETDETGEECYCVPHPSPALNRDFALKASQAAFLREALENSLIRGQLPGLALRCLANLLCFHAPFDAQTQGEDPVLTRADAWLFKSLRAAAEGKALQITYPTKGKSADMETRVISPWGAYTHNGAAYLVAGCHKDRIPKVFALFRMGRVEFSEEPAMEKPADFKLETYAKARSFLFGGHPPMTAVLKVEREGAWRLEEGVPWCVRKRNEDGSLEAEFEVSSPEHFYRYTLGFGASAEILGPKELRDGFKKLIGSAL